MARRGRAGWPVVGGLDRPVGPEQGPISPQGQSSRPASCARIATCTRLASVELDQQPRHVGLHGGLAHEQRRADLGVGQPLPDLDEHLPLAIGSPASRACGLLGGARPAGRPRSGRSAGGSPPGDSIASPAATTRTACDQLQRRRVLQQEPGGPGLQRAEHEVVQVERGEHDRPRGGSAMACSAAVAASPSIRGIRMSISTTSGRCARTASTTSVPSSASPTTSRSSADSQDHPQPGADQRLVVDDQDASHAAPSTSRGRSATPCSPAARTAVDAARGQPGVDPPAAVRRRARASACRRRSATRSRSPIKPAPEPGSRRRRPRPARWLMTSTAHAGPARRRRPRSSVAAPRACLCTLVSASCTTRYTVRPRHPAAR